MVDYRYFSGGWGDYTDIPLGTIFICPTSPSVPPQKKNQISYIKYAKNSSYNVASSRHKKMESKLHKYSTYSTQRISVSL